MFYIVLNKMTASLTLLLLALFCALPHASRAFGAENSAVVHIGDSDDNESGATVESIWSDGSGSGPDVFIPTHEWQTVKQDQAIPRGLHVRMDMQTGEKQAKFMDGHKENTKKLKLSEMEKAIGDLEDKRPEDLETNSHTPEQIKEIKDKFRSKDELKKDFETMNLGLKSDTQIMTALLEKYKMKNTTEIRKQQILEDINFLVHQIDNAMNFVEMGGMDIVKSALNVTNVPNKVVAIKIIGTASQNNPKVKVGVLEAGLLHTLIRLFVDASTDLRKSILFSISAILRNFPYAQMKFFELGGSEILSSAFEDVSVDSHSLRVKAATLISDLVKEHEFADTSPKLQEQYDKIRLGSLVKESSWCEKITKLFGHVDSLSRKEAVLKSMDSLLPFCADTILEMSPLLISERNELLKYSQEEIDSDLVEIYMDLMGIIDRLVLVEPNSDRTSGRNEL